MGHWGEPSRGSAARCILGALALALGWAACSLGNISSDGCEDDAQCAAAFGLGSTCDDGFCGEAGTCVTGHDCRARYGGGACVGGLCSASLPPDPDGVCTAFEPDDLAGRPLGGAGAPVIVGAMFGLDDSSNDRRAKAVRLAAREINATGLGEGRPIGVVFCDVGGPNNALQGDERRQRVRAVTDYLAGTLGVPYVVGPNTSTDSLTAINHVVAQRYPTVLISPAATSPALTTEPDRLDSSDPHGLLWRTSPSDVVQGRVLATDVIGLYPTVEPTIDLLAVVYLDDSYGLGLANEIQLAWGVERTSLFPFGAGVDWDELVAAIELQGPHAIVMVAIDPADTLGFIQAMAGAPVLSTSNLYLTDGSKDEAQLLDPSLETEVRDILFNQVVGTAPAAPSGAEYNLFRAAYEKEFSADPSGFSFVANAYDAAYVGAAGVVYAASVDPLYDGRTVAAGLARLTTGATVALGPGGWGAIKSALTSEPRTVDVVGVSGPLDFDPIVGEAPAPIEVWRPSDDPALCDGTPPCFARVTVLE